MVGGGIVGDPSNAALTRMARDLGWPGGRPPGRFDLLPLLVQEAGAPVTMHDIPADAVFEVAIEHPDYRWFANLGLRWYAVPVISDMYLDIGGIRYPAAPFNGWYMGTEIGSRNFGDIGRYDELREIAAHMGLSTATDRTLWKDRALTELNVAVLHSFDAAGAAITDHHTESVRFLQHIDREERHGRGCPVDWSWIVPPAASSATPVFHRYYRDYDQTPNFYRHPAPGLAADDAQAPPPEVAEVDKAPPGRRCPSSRCGPRPPWFRLRWCRTPRGTARAGPGQPARVAAARGGAGCAVPPSGRGPCPAPPDDRGTGRGGERARFVSCCASLMQLAPWRHPSVDVCRKQPCRDRKAVTSARL